MNFSAAYLRKFFLISLGAALVACAPEGASMQIIGLNYTDKPIPAFSVNGYRAASIRANGGGGFACCIGVPLRWRKGMQVNVRWSDNVDDFDTFKEISVEVPEYGEQDLGFLSVHFYPDGSIKVLVTDKTATHPVYPYPRPN